MSDISTDKPEPVGNRGGWGKKRQRWDGNRWATLSPEKREQYERIEERVRKKMAKGLL